MNKADFGGENDGDEQKQETEVVLRRRRSKLNWTTNTGNVLENYVKQQKAFDMVTNDYLKCKASIHSLWPSRDSTCVAVLLHCTPQWV